MIKCSENKQISKLKTTNLHIAEECIYTVHSIERSICVSIQKKIKLPNAIILNDTIHLVYLLMLSKEYKITNKQWLGSEIKKFKVHS